MSSEGTSHGRNSQSPTPNTSNSNSVNSTPTKIITSNNPAINTQHQPIIIPNTRRVIGSQEALNQEVEAVFSRKVSLIEKVRRGVKACHLPPLPPENRIFRQKPRFQAVFNCFRLF